MAPKTSTTENIRQSPYPGHLGSEESMVVEVVRMGCVQELFR